MDFQTLVGLIGAHNALIVFAAFGVASMVIAFLPAPKSTTSVYGYIWRAINALAMNWGNGKTASHPDIQTIINDLKDQNSNLKSQVQIYRTTVNQPMTNTLAAKVGPSPSAKA